MQSKKGIESMSKEINVLELRKHLGELINEVHFQKEVYTVTKNGKPAAILLDVELYLKLIQRKDGPTAPQAAAGPVEDAFIETYTRERIEEFLKEDKAP